MNKNYLYVGIIVVLVVLGFVFYRANKNETEGVDTDDTSQTNNNTSGAVNKPLPKPNAVVPSLASLEGTTFRLATYNGAPVPAGANYTLNFDNGNLSAKFCNNMSGLFTLDNGLVKVANLVSTKMFCSVPASAMKIESDFANMLGFGAYLTRDGNNLVLGDLKDTTMVFTGFAASAY